jgi:hypothetical protein
MLNYSEFAQVPLEFDDFFQLLMDKTEANSFSNLSRSMGDHTVALGTTPEGKDER